MTLVVAATSVTVSEAKAFESPMAPERAKRLPAEEMPGRVVSVSVGGDWSTPKSWRAYEDRLPALS